MGYKIMNNVLQIKRNTDKNQSQSGQALAFALPMLLLVLLFCGYFLFSSETYFRFFTNAENSNMKKLKELASYANILNEISINNQNIVASIASAQRGLFSSLETGLYVSFHQPYWDTYGISMGVKKSKDTLSDTSKNIIKSSFSIYSLTTSRGFFMAGALAKRNEELISQLPKELSSYIYPSTNAQVHCFALKSQKNLLNNPGVLNIFVPHKYVFQFYLQISKKNSCLIEHKANKLTTFIQKRLPNFFIDKDNSVFNFEKIDTYSSSRVNYGISYIDPKYKEYFMKSLNFKTENHIEEDEKFSEIYRFFSKIPYFKSLKDNQESVLKSNTLVNTFELSNQFIFCAKDSNCKHDDNDFLKAFFSPTWSVAGFYERQSILPNQRNENSEIL